MDPGDKCIQFARICALSALIGTSKDMVNVLENFGGNGDNKGPAGKGDENRPEVYCCTENRLRNKSETFGKICFIAFEIKVLNSGKTEIRMS